MNLEKLFQKLWSDYAKRTPSAIQVKDLFESYSGSFLNDHVAIRTFNDQRVNIDAISEAFTDVGYEYVSDYHFEQKKLYAKHFAHKTDPTAPLVFISEARLELFSEEIQDVVNDLLDSIDFSSINYKELVFQGRLWEQPSYKLYNELLHQSEYIAWLYVNGFCANHFTVNVNSLDKFDSLAAVNAFLKENGFRLNDAGGEIKGTPEQYLEQSSIVADTIYQRFQEGIFETTSCYFEFAYRHKQLNGELFKGFIAGSADKIFESTDMELALK